VVLWKLVEKCASLLSMPPYRQKSPNYQIGLMCYTMDPYQESSHKLSYLNNKFASYQNLIVNMLNNLPHVYVAPMPIGLFCNLKN
jgi:hypothetical protein